MSINGDTWGSFTSNYTPELARELIYIADATQHTLGDSPVSPDDLADLRLEIVNLYEQLSASTIHPTLKTVLYDGLQRLLTAIDRYDKFGPRSLRDALDNNIAYLELHKDQFHQAATADHETLVINYANLILNLANTIYASMRLISEEAETTRFLLTMTGTS